MYRLDRLLPATLEPADWQMLQDLQGNIIKAHGRKYTRHLFLRFAGRDEGLELVGELASRVTSAAQQVESSGIRREYFAAFRISGEPAPPPPEELFVGLLLTAQGYRRLGATDYMPGDEAFARGMADDLGDPSRAEWQREFAEDPDALLILAYGSRTKDRDMLNVIENGFLRLIGRRALVLARERGEALKRRFGTEDRNVEHFGYADGRSQPLLTEDEVSAEDAAFGSDRWSPGLNLDRALVPCPGGEESGLGSYLVFRKLEQDVRGFVAATAAEAWKLNPASPERAAAMTIGRFEDGTSLALLSVAGGEWSNNFNYGSDPTGLRCPLGGHVRKMNPRDPLQEQRSHLFVRRGIPYDDRPATERERSPTPGEGGGGNPSNLPGPGGGVGLLFMCYNADIADQFEHVQRNWANDQDYLGAGVGVDPIVGQGTGGRTYSWPVSWGGPATCSVSFERWVRMRGGGYFFAPSISFLRRLSAGGLRRGVLVPA